MPMSSAKKKIANIWNKKLLPKTIERTLKSWKKIWIIFWGKGLKNLKMPMSSVKMKNVEKLVLPKF
jgi:hypothetical protein